MRLQPDHHLRHPWFVHRLVPDFDLLDVWRFPITASPENGETFTTVCTCFLEQMQRPDQFKGPTGFLFKLRKSMGRVFGWDETQSALSIPGCSETSVRERLSAVEVVTMPAVKIDEMALFTPVYERSSEVLYEISNQTAHALLHLGWVPVENGAFTVQIAVYVKSRGWLGRMYMALIAPFRHWIVYPTMMQWMGRRWEVYRKRVAAAHFDHSKASRPLEGVDLIDTIP